MNAELINFAARLGHSISLQDDDYAFNGLALELFRLQFNYNPPYRRFCEARSSTPISIRHWTEIPFVPAAAFKELDLSCIAPDNRTSVFHSSGTTEQKPSRHFHCAESLALYETSLWKAFEQNVAQVSKPAVSPISKSAGRPNADNRKYSPQLAPDGPPALDLVVLSPFPRRMPYSSLVHMFETIRQQLAAPESVFVGESDAQGAWVIDFDAALAALRATRRPKLILGTAFSFVHLLDFLAEKQLRLQMPEGTRVMETGGYKNRSRTMPKTELHSLIAEFLGIPREQIICEYGMSELSSQAYDAGNAGHHFHFPPWARAQIVSPESGREVAEGETGLIRIFDLANVFSVAAIQTEDLAVRRGDGFELMGRAAQAEPRGCSLMTA